MRPTLSPLLTKCQGTHHKCAGPESAGGFMTTDNIELIPDN